MSTHHPLRLLLFVFLLTSLACQLSTQTAVPQPLPTQAASGTVIFKDDFSDPSTGWDRQAAAQGMMDYSAGAYRMLVSATQTNTWSTAKKDLSNVRLEVDEGKLGGPDENRVGLICRYSGGDYYFFLVTHDGFYGIGMFKGGVTSLLGQSEMQASAIINRGTNINHLRADCVGDALTLYVNGQQVAAVKDSTLTHGDVGLLAGAFSQPGVDVVFDNFVAIQP
jgi:hypothetical protein